MSKTNRVFDNLIWRFMERCGAQLVTFFVSIVLARLLSPEDYGRIAIITVIITILNGFVDSGFANALIQKRDADELDFSSVFYFNFASCMVLYLITWILAPFIAIFYNDVSIIHLTRVLALTIIISGIKNVQQAYVSKKFLFKKFFFSTLGGTLFSAIIGITMAYLGCGVWSIVVQHLSNTFIDTLVLWYTVKWRPGKCFSWKRIKILFGFGYKLLLSSFLNTLYDNFRQLIIGKIYSSADLSYYNRGKQFPALIVTNIGASIDSVLFPAMAEQQDDYSQIKNVIRKSIITSTFILWPLLFGLAAVAEPVVSIVLTDKWLCCVPYLQILCFMYMTFPIQTASNNAFKAVGNSNIFLKLEILETIVGITLLVMVIKVGALWIAVMNVVSSFVNCILITNESRKLFNYGFFKQARDVLSNFGLSAIMFIVVYYIYVFIPCNWIIFIQIPVGIAIYLIGANIANCEGLHIICNYLNILLSKNRKSCDNN